MREQDIEDARVKMGLSIVLLSEAISATPAEQNMLRGRAKPSEELEKKVLGLLAEYSEWKTRVLTKVAEIGELNTWKLARLLSISEWNLYQLIHRRRLLSFAKTTTRQHTFNLKNVQDLFDLNESHLAGVFDGRQSGPLGRALLDYRSQRDELTELAI